MAKKDITSLRGTLDYLKGQNKVIEIDKEVDPICEISGLLKALDGGPAITFTNIKGYPEIRNVGNLISTRESISNIFGWNGPKAALENCRQALFNHIPPQIVEDAPCQEVIIAEDIDLLNILPVIQHTKKDVGRIIGGGIYLISGDYFDGGTEISFKRTMPLGKNLASVMFVGGTHIWHVAKKHEGEKIPTTINIGTPPAVLIVAGGGGISAGMPWGGDELGIAGALQGAPVTICKAKTVDAYAIAQSEWVIEGYIHATQNVWESKEAEKVGRGRIAPFFPEWPKYFGRARKVWSFEATAITHRREKPYYYTPLADSFESDMTYALLREAYFYHLAEGLAPGLVQDVNQLYPAFQSLKVKVKKRGAYDDGWIHNLIVNAFAAFTGLRLAVFVDEDVDIHNGEDVFWAMATRVHPESDLFMIPGGKGTGMMPIEASDQTTGQVLRTGTFFKGIGIDATIPFSLKWNFERANYPSGEINLEKWLSNEDIAAVRAVQSDYAKLLARIGG